MTAYPSHREADVVLRNGSTAHIRPIKAEDEPALRAFYEGLSLNTVGLRFFSGAVDLAKVALWAIDVDYVSRFGLVATTGSPERIVAHASYVSTAPEHAEIALEVADELQGAGIGTLLIAHLAEAAAENGVTLFEGTVLRHNHKMVEVFRETGFPLDVSEHEGDLLIEFPTSLTPKTLERFDQREQVATSAALRTILSPRSVAVVGASRSRGTIGGEIFHNLLSNGFNGPVYPVNPSAGVVQSVVAYPTVEDIPGPVDLAVIVVPAAVVIEAARSCARKDVRALVVISAGFGEIGEEGRQRQQELLAVCRETGMRMIGPNCLGIMNASPDVRLNATFGPLFPPHGHIAFLSQSGALGLAVIDHAAELGLGISTFVSAGNKADISGNDLLQFWDEDPDTELILLYLESFGNPRRFARLARRIGKRKPVIAVKSGRSQAGARATSSHTGAMLAASDITVDALFRQAGVIRTDTLAEMFDVAALLATQPPPRGNRIGIITNAGGPAILCADACEASGLTVPPIPDEVKARIAKLLPAEAGLTNPVDMIASASAEDYGAVIRELAAWDGIDALVAIFIPPLVTRADDVARAIRGAVTDLPRDIPVLSVFMSAHGVPAELSDEQVRIPSYAFPEDAARALARAVAYGTWRERPEHAPATFEDVRRDEARALIAGALADGPGWLEAGKVADLLGMYGIAFIPSATAADAVEVGRIAGSMGGPVAIKAIGPALLHKTEAGAVALNIAAADAEATARAMAERLHPESFVVQPMAEPGIEMLVGVVSDPTFGPVIACGAGGTAVELLNDVAVRITPLSDVDATEMIRSLRTYPLLQGFRGAPANDIAALEQIVLRVSIMVEAHREIAEMDLNPVIVHPDGAVAVDARVRLERAAPRRPLGARR